MRPLYEKSVLQAGEWKLYRFARLARAMLLEIKESLLERIPKNGSVLTYAAPEKQDFYRKFGLGSLKLNWYYFQSLLIKQITQRRHETKSPQSECA